MREEPHSELQGRIAAARSVFVLTGAGMSAESGIATFRDAMTGLWSRFDPAQLASEEGFRADPARVWDWYAERRANVRAAQPNAGHQALGAFARRRPGVLTLVSQNVDDLHQRAGVAATLRLHGDILADRWLQRCPRSPACAPATEGRPPRCDACGNLVRPAVVWFGEMLADADLRAAVQATLCDVFVTVGTSSVVYPAAGLVEQARHHGAFTVEINAEATPATAVVDLAIHAPAEVVLPEVDRLL